MVPVVGAPSITVDTNKVSYLHRQKVIVSVSGGTPNGIVMIQFEDPIGVVWVDQDNFDGDGEFEYQLEIPLDWSTGSYTVRVKDSETGQEGSMTFTVTTPPPSPPPRPSSPPNKLPVADVGPNQTVYIGQFVEFSGANSTDLDGTITSYEWDFGDEIEASGVNVSHRYLEVGNYTVTLTVRDNRYGVDTDTCTITVREHIIPVPPLPPFLSNLNIAPAEVELGDEVTISLDIMNPNNQSITYFVTMKIGWLTLLVEVELEAYESKTVSRTVTRSSVGVYNVTVDGMTGSFTVEAPEIPLKPAEFVVSDLTITLVEVDLLVIEDWFKITANVTNIGEQEGTHTVDLKVDGEVVDWRTVKLKGGEETTILYDVSRGVGSYTVEVDGLTGSFTVKAPPKPAEFEVADLEIAPEEVEEGEEVTIAFTVSNVGEEEGVYTVELTRLGWMASRGVSR